MSRVSIVVASFALACSESNSPSPKWDEGEPSEITTVPDPGTTPPGTPGTTPGTTPPADTDLPVDTDLPGDTDLPADTDLPVEPAPAPGPGCIGTPYATIQDALDAAADGDVIEVCAGTYPEHLAVAGKTLTLRSLDGAAATIVDAAGGQGLVVSGGADVVLEGFTVRNGSTGNVGGNVECDGATLVLRANVIERGDADRGGGASFVGCAGLVEGNTFRDNHTLRLGGGLYAEGTIDVLGNTFEGNATDKDGGGAYLVDSFGLVGGNVVRANLGVEDGGGVYVDGGAPFVDGNTFEDNDIDGEGGGLRIKLSQASVTDNTFTNNHADWRGGGMKISHDECVISGNTWVGNSTWVTGGAVFLFESASDVSFETYTDNWAADEGGAVAIDAGWDGPTFTDCVFEANEADLGGHLHVALALFRTRLVRVDLLDGVSDVSGGAIYALTDADLDLRNVVIAGSTAGVSGGAIAVDGATGRIANSVVYGNDAPDGAALHVVNGRPFEVVNTVFAANTGGAAISYVASPLGLEPTFRYDDFSGNAGDFAGMADRVWQDGNTGDAPAFVAPLAGDFTLQPGSALVDAGDPALDDADGSRSDIGRWGGEQAF